MHATQQCEQHTTAQKIAKRLSQRRQFTQARNNNPSYTKGRTLILPQRTPPAVHTVLESQTQPVAHSKTPAVAIVRAVQQKAPRSSSTNRAAITRTVHVHFAASMSTQNSTQLFLRARDRGVCIARHRPGARVEQAELSKGQLRTTNGFPRSICCTDITHVNAVVNQ